MRTTYCFGDDGDLIYLSCLLQEPTDLVLYPGKAREPYTLQKVERIREFLEYQKHATPLNLSCRKALIQSVRFEQKPDMTGKDKVVLDLWRKGYCRGKNLQQMACDYFGKNNRPHIELPWLFVDSPRHVVPFVFHRSPRYHSKDFPWRQLVKVYGEFAAFVGSQTEHKNFCGRFGNVPYLHTPTVFDLARVIAGCLFFVGNQSMPRALAESLKKPVYVEQWGDHNTKFRRHDAFYDLKDSALAVGRMKSLASHYPESVVFTGVK